MRLDKVRKLQRALYRGAKRQPARRFTLLYDKVCRQDILQEAWRRVKANKGAAGVDQVDIEAIRDYGEERFLNELEQELRSRRYRVAWVRRVHIPKPGQPGKTRPLGIPTVKDRVVQMAVKLVIEPLFEADFRPCSFGFRPKKTPRMALGRRTAEKRWGRRFLHQRCRLYHLVGKVSHLEGLRRTPPDEDDRRAGCGKTARPVR